MGFDVLPGDMYYHPAQMRLKKVRAKDNLPELYNQDPRWQHQNQLARMSCLAILSQMSGMDCLVISAWQTDKTIMYGVKLAEGICAPNEAGMNMMHDKVQFPHDYFEVIDIGFAEAR